ncbi:MAG: hypothetical protein ACPGPE_17580, partial [Planctomycetota bacterium]
MKRRSDTPRLAACPCCGLVSRIPDAEDRVTWSCGRCGEPLPQASSGRLGGRVSSRVAALSATALTLFPAAVLLPVFEV